MYIFAYQSVSKNLAFWMKSFKVGIKSSVRSLKVAPKQVSVFIDRAASNTSFADLLSSLFESKLFLVFLNFFMNNNQNINSSNFTEFFANLDNFWVFIWQFSNLFVVFKYLYPKPYLLQTRRLEDVLVECVLFGIRG